MKWIALVALLPLLLVTDCAFFSHEHLIAIGDGFDDTETAMIHEAADAWNQYADRPIRIVDRDEVTQRVQKVERLEKSGRSLDGLYSGGSGYVYLRSGMPYIRFRFVIRHEFGHMLGLPHHAVNGMGVMSNPGGTDPTLTDADIWLCRDYDACH